MVSIPIMLKYTHWIHNVADPLRDINNRYKVSTALPLIVQFSWDFFCVLLFIPTSTGGINLIHASMHFLKKQKQYSADVPNTNITQSSSAAFGGFWTALIFSLSVCNISDQPNNLSEHFPCFHCNIARKRVFRRIEKYPRHKTMIIWGQKRWERPCHSVGGVLDH